MTTVVRRPAPAADEASAPAFRQYPRRRPDRTGVASAHQAGGAARSVSRDEAGLRASARRADLHPAGLARGGAAAGAPD